MRPSKAVLKALEEESIEILRETAATFNNPVMLYSIGKDSAVLLHLAKKAFYPAEIPFKLLHVDTTWKFQEMITFRDEIVKKYGVSMISLAVAAEAILGSDIKMIKRISGKIILQELARRIKFKLLIVKRKII